MVHGSEYEALSDRSVANFIQTGTDPEWARASASTTSKPGKNEFRIPDWTLTGTDSYYLLHSLRPSPWIQSDTALSLQTLTCSWLEIVMQDFYLLVRKHKIKILTQVWMHFLSLACAEWWGDTHCWPHSICVGMCVWLIETDFQVWFSTWQVLKYHVSWFN